MDRLDEGVRMRVVGGVARTVDDDDAAVVEPRIECLGRGPTNVPALIPAVSSTMLRALHG